MLHEGDEFIYKGKRFELLYLDHTGDEKEEYAIVCSDILNDYDDSESSVGTVSPNASDEEVMVIIEDNYSSIDPNNKANGTHLVPSNGRAKDVVESLGNRHLIDFYKESASDTFDVYDIDWDYGTAIVWYDEQPNDDYDRFVDYIVNNVEFGQLINEYTITANFVKFIDERKEVFNKFMEENNRQGYRPSDYEEEDDLTEISLITLISLLNGNYAEEDYGALLRAFGNKTESLKESGHMHHNKDESLTEKVGLSSDEIESEKDKINYKYYGDEPHRPENLLRKWSKRDEQKINELSFRSWVNSCLAYGGAWHLKPEELQEVRGTIGDSTLGLYEISLDRALEIIEEQKERFEKATVEYGGTDGEGVSYNSVKWDTKHESLKENISMLDMFDKVRGKR